MSMKGEENTQRSMISPRVLRRLIAGSICIVLALGLGLFDLARHKLSVPFLGISQKTAEEGEELPKGPIEESLEIKRGDSLSTVLERAGVDTDQANAVIDSLKSVFNPRALRPEHELYITYQVPPDDVLHKDLIQLYLKVSLDLIIIVEQDEAGIYVARKVAKELVQEYRAIEGVVEESLYLSATRKGAHPQILHDMIAAFSYDVDFQRSFQPGDEYGLLYDTYKDPESLQERPGTLQYAYLKLQGREIRIFRFRTKLGGWQYYNDRGESVKKGLLRTPIDGARISSGFGNRKHPVLGYTMKHKGVDFAAPKGTPIMAAGDGRIQRIGPFSTYGNYICIQHSGTYATAYAHLSRFARGLKCGSHVRQGQVIGYVGATGRTSGPHLHYEILKGGQQINPKLIKMLPSGKLKASDLVAFEAAKQQLEANFLKEKKKQPPLAPQPVEPAEEADPADEGV